MKALAINVDERTCVSLQKALSGHGVDVERRSLEEAKAALERNRYAAIFLNCGDQESARKILSSVHDAPHNRSAVIIGVVGGEASASAAMRLGVMLVIQVPIATEMLSRNIRAAYSLMVRKRPRNERVEVGTAITLNIPDQAISGRLANVSEHGLGVELPEPPPVGTAVRFSFSLPDTAAEIEGKGAVVWTSDKGECGIRIQELASSGAKTFTGWLESRLRPTEVKDFFKHLAASVQQQR